MKKIQITLELDPAIALLLGMLINSSAQGDMSVYKMLQPEGAKEMCNIAQEITNQVAKRTDFAELQRDVLTLENKASEKVNSSMPGRNDPCFCGSGKKYKRCHGLVN